MNIPVNPQNPKWSPKFKLLNVLRSVNVTPRMRRLTLGGVSLQDFAVEPDVLEPHIHLDIPPEGIAEPRWPELVGDGTLLVDIAEGPDAPDGRTYSLRAIDLEKNELDIDFVLHGDEGPGSRFAMRAQPGDRIGVWWPHGPHHEHADWYLIVGDHTALPAMSWMLERLPEATRAKVIIEVPDAAEEQVLKRPAGVSVTWIHLDGAAPGTDDRLRDAALAVEWPASGSNFLWVGAEQRTARALRQHARKILELSPRQYNIVNYWKRGAMEGTFREEE